MAFVYILESLKDGRLYTGSTVDLVRRLKQHRAGKVTATKSRLPVRLVYFEEMESSSAARQREIFLKTPKGGVMKKELIRNFLAQYSDPEKLLEK
ncbi:MAG: GIY-YIG nuclease family protein [candidate division KSB1 bacterium]|nr:GIY-YIG nuclease family protein [candidate division KSB1 bacterium]MDZ7305231.1 GIY-YIG nuclease family protein [candidate division KSB1 bacterium]MDZ7314342.1 GIY-YIG nuclease family protein [candidate division KSB1 bacterium]